MSDDLQSEIQLLELSLDDLFQVDVEVPVVEAKKARRGGPKATGPKVCKDCGESDQSKLHRRHDKRRGKTYILNWCNKCASAYTLKLLKKNPELQKKYQKKVSEKLKQERKDGIKVERFIWADCKGADKKFGREFDLTKEYIKEQIDKGCQYCGETSIRMTMDRIDNAIGHIKTNVVPACIRCNYVRRDMPYKAWLRMADSMRAAREAGEFGDWTCEIQRGTRKLRKVQKGAKAA